MEPWFKLRVTQTVEDTPLLTLGVGDKALAA